jgi:Arc/MetJ-type ribon-helix-helix transcriptional regulator
MPSVQISEEMYRKIEQILNQSEQYDSVDSFVDFVLREVMFKPGAEDKDMSSAITERLKALGYL